jgi:tryptophan synthase alpha chain
VAPLLDQIHAHTPLPVAVGFGISNPEQVRQIQSLAEGAVVGSALVRFMEEHLNCQDLPSQVEQYTRWLLGKD